jgi:hypothetical protein
MQPQCCLHNIVGERIFPSRIPEHGMKFLIRVTLLIVTAKPIRTLEFGSRTGPTG